MYGPETLDVVTGLPCARLPLEGGAVVGEVVGGVVVGPPVGGVVGPLPHCGAGHGPQAGVSVYQPELPAP